MHVGLVELVLASLTGTGAIRKAAKPISALDVGKA
jgi:hypothetical protein